MNRSARFAAAGAVLLGLLLLVPGAWAQPAAPGDDAVLVAEVRGPITPVLAEHVSDALRHAAQGGYHALVVEIDTPGGLDTSMRVIVQDFLVAPVPVILHVAPPGARAASAGAVIALSAHVVSMAPGTNIGAATPIALEGGEVIDKVVEDAVAYVTAIAEARDRDIGFAVDMVRDGRSIPYSEALELGVADVIARDRAELLREVDGMVVTLEPDDREVTLATADATLVEFELSGLRRILQALADPNLAFLFLSLGGLAILYELANPGAGIGGVIGAIMLILAFFALAVLPTSIAGILLLVLAMALFVAELFVPGVGVFAAGGALALIAAGLFLFQQPTGIGIDWAVLLPVPLVVAVAAVFVGRLVWRTQRGRAPAGIVGSMAGAVGEVRSVDGARVRVHLGGSLWKARTAGPELRVGQEVRVVRVEGIELVVEPAEAAADRSDA